MPLAFRMQMPAILTSLTSLWFTSKFRGGTCVHNYQLIWSLATKPGVAHWWCIIIISMHFQCQQYCWHLLPSSSAAQISSAVLQQNVNEEQRGFKHQKHCWLPIAAPCFFIFHINTNLQYWLVISSPRGIPRNGWHRNLEQGIRFAHFWVFIGRYMWLPWHGLCLTERAVPIVDKGKQLCWP